MNSMTLNCTPIDGQNDKYYVVHACSVTSDSVTPWTAAQAPLSMEFSRQAYWSGLPFPSAEDLPNPGIETISPALQADSLLSETPVKPFVLIYRCKNQSFWSKMRICRNSRWKCKVLQLGKWRAILRMVL